MEGRTVNEIVKFAETNDTDLIVMAMRGLRGVEHLLPGSATEKIVRIAPRPVLSAKAFGKS